MKQVNIYTDGACRGNPGPGGWGSIVRYKTIERTLSGGEKNTTNNRMELTAVIEALKILKEPCKVDLYSDYKYGDIVVLRKEAFLEEPIVKRVIATEGQTVDSDFDAGVVYVDGQALEEDYINEPTCLEEGTEFPLTVPEGSIFVMGDNRNHSNDSRDSRLGTVDARYVIGKAVFLAFPGPDIVTEKCDYSRIGVIK